MQQSGRGIPQKASTPGSVEICHRVPIPRADGNNTRCATTNINSGTSERQNRRRLLQLSCGEFRKKKTQLSCDRNLLCKRCVRSGRLENCSFGTANGQPPPYDPFALQQANNKIQDLQDELARLTESLSKPESDSIVAAAPTSMKVECIQAPLLSENSHWETFADANSTKLSVLI